MAPCITLSEVSSSSKLCCRSTQQSALNHDRHFTVALPTSSRPMGSLQVAASTRSPRSIGLAVLRSSRQMLTGFQNRRQNAVLRGSSLHSSAAVTRCATAEEKVAAEIEFIEEDALERMEKSLESVKNNFNTVRTGRASPSLLDRVEVEYYGAPTPLRSIAQVTTPDGSTIMISPFDKSSLASIEKSIQKSDLGLNPSNDGNVIRLSIPQLTAERRKELLKLVSKLAEDGKVALRNVRRDTLKAYEKLEKEKKLSEDEMKGLEADVQKLTDDYVKKVDTICKTKEKELSTV
eukprot:TRINITY_DN35993_c0_g1_i1.p1 TRINITY_DN35993_c0_g1~~TRINITY_DN35993_c0_g1_i1.p1  ORF type:complete len:291 (+),score=70.07 TRINITY_DN35993_c0_g1_i1:113-985(+)